MPAAGAHGEITAMLMAKKYFTEIAASASATSASCPTPRTARIRRARRWSATASCRSHRRAAAAPTRRAARQARRLDRRVHDDQPQHARAVRRRHHRDRRRRCTPPAGSCTTMVRMPTPSSACAGRATWASTSCTSTCTRRSPCRTVAAVRARVRSARNAKLAKYLPRPLVVRDADGSFALDWNGDMPRASAPCACFWSHFLAVVRAYAYIIVHGEEGSAPQQPARRAQRELRARESQGCPHRAVRRLLPSRVRVLGRGRSRKRPACGRSIWPRACSTPACTRRPCTGPTSCPSAS